MIIYQTQICVYNLQSVWNQESERFWWVNTETFSSCVGTSRTFILSVLPGMSGSQPFLCRARDQQKEFRVARGSEDSGLWGKNVSPKAATDLSSLLLSLF